MSDPPGASAAELLGVGAWRAGDLCAIVAIACSGMPVRRYSYARSGLPIAALSAERVSRSGNPIAVSDSTASGVTKDDATGVAGAATAAAAAAAGAAAATGAAATAGAGAATGSAAILGYRQKR